MLLPRRLRLRALDPRVLTSRHRGPSIGGVEAQQRGDQRLARLADMAPTPLVVVDRLLEARGRVKRRIAAQQPEDDQADAEEVDGEAVVPMLQHLGSEPTRRAAHHVEGDVATCFGTFCKAEVAKLDDIALPLAEEQEVVRLDVGVDQATDIVEMPDRCEHLAGAIPDLRLAEGLPIPHHAPQVAMRRERRDEQQRLRSLLRREKPDHIGMRRHRRVDRNLRQGTPALLLAVEA
mmetsp:Transcript_117514/g.339772  ORF Transcript_117514/g.339772 Transcript_117514/m.339772 type:complete len:234 (+) Transcript_117514:325-1026(+)